jgi:hypothetical protein
VALAGSLRSEAEQQNLGPVSLGKLTPFWRNHPKCDRWIRGWKSKGDGGRVAEGTHISLVRFLGGWRKRAGGEKGDLAYRDESGKIQYRWDRLHGSLDSWIGVGVKKQGLELTIVLDDIPYCFPEKPAMGGYGQVAPPRDFKEWEAFIEAMCREILNRYGAETANRLRFRVGTEANWAHRFAGTPEQFYQHYDHAAAAVKRVLPDAKIGPYNVIGARGTMEEVPGSMNNVDTVKLAQHCATGKNYATGKIGSPLDFTAVSCYYRYRGVGEDGAVIRVEDADPEAKADIKGDFWDAISAVHPRFKDIPREVHEWRFAGKRELARGNAAVFHNVIRLRERGMDKLWQWNYPVWIFSVFDQAVGGNTYLLHPQVTPAPGSVPPLDARDGDVKALNWLDAYKGPNRPTKVYPTQTKCVAVKCKDRTFIMLSAYNIDPYRTTRDQITISVPDRLLPVSGAKNVQYSGVLRTGTEEFLQNRLLIADGQMDRLEELRHNVAKLGKEIDAIVKSAKAANRPLSDAETEQKSALSKLRKSTQNETTELAKPLKEKHADSFAALPNSDVWKPWPGNVEQPDGQHRFSMVLAPSSMLVIVVGP